MAAKAVFPLPSLFLRIRDMFIEDVAFFFPECCFCLIFWQKVVRREG